MNIGNYRPDGNIMTVPEIKEKVDTIQGNVTTLNEAVGEVETDLAETISDLNNTKSDVSDNASNIADLQVIVNRLLSEKIGKYVNGEEVSYNEMGVLGCDTNQSKRITITINDQRITENSVISIQKLGLGVRFGRGGFVHYNNGSEYIALTTTDKIVIENGTSVSPELTFEVVNVSNNGFNVNLDFNSQLTTDTTGATVITNNMPLFIFIDMDYIIRY